MTAPTCECVTSIVRELSHEECEKLFLCSNSSCSTLKELDFDSCDLMSVPKEVEKMIKLEKLTLTRMPSLKSLPAEMGHLMCLKKLFISGCAIESLPGSIGRLQQLEEISLSFLDSLKNVPKEMGDLCNLKKLSFTQCSIECLPDNLTSLKSLDLSRLDKLLLQPKDITLFSRLRKLLVVSCAQFFAGATEKLLHEFCSMLMDHSRLDDLYLSGHSEEMKTMLAQTLQNNGSVVLGYVQCPIECKDIFFRNSIRHRQVLPAVVCVLAIRKTAMFPRELIGMIAQYLWVLRCAPPTEHEGESATKKQRVSE